MAGQFPTTRWSVVLNAAQDPDEPGREAFHDLCKAYWRPLYVFLRHEGVRAEDAEDTVQGFLSSLLDGSGISAVDPERGRFRSYLLAALRNYRLNQRVRANAIKRGGGRQPVPLTIGSGEAERTLEIPDDSTPEQAYAQAWAKEILAKAHMRLRERYEGMGRVEQFDALEVFLTNTDTPSYREVAGVLSTTDAHARMLVHRLRTRFGAALREEVAATVSSPDDIDDELRAVMEAVVR